MMLWMLGMALLVARAARLRSRRPARAARRGDRVHVSAAARRSRGGRELRADVVLPRARRHAHADARIAVRRQRQRRRGVGADLRPPRRAAAGCRGRGLCRLGRQLDDLRDATARAAAAGDARALSHVAALAERAAFARFLRTSAPIGGQWLLDMTTFAIFTVDRRAHGRRLDGGEPGDAAAAVAVVHAGARDRDRLPARSSAATSAPATLDAAAAQLPLGAVARARRVTAFVAVLFVVGARAAARDLQREPARARARRARCSRSARSSRSSMRSASSRPARCAARATRAGRSWCRRRSRGCCGCRVVYVAAIVAAAAASSARGLGELVYLFALTARVRAALPAWRMAQRTGVSSLSHAGRDQERPDFAGGREPNRVNELDRVRACDHVATIAIRDVGNPVDDVARAFGQRALESCHFAEVAPRAAIARVDELHAARRDVCVVDRVANETAARVAQRRLVRLGPCAGRRYVGERLAILTRLIRVVPTRCDPNASTERQLRSPSAAECDALPVGGVAAAVRSSFELIYAVFCHPDVCVRDPAPPAVGDAYD